MHDFDAQLADWMCLFTECAWPVEASGTYAGLVVKGRTTVSGKGIAIGLLVTAAVCASPTNRQGVIEIVGQIQRADYEGNRAEL